MPSSIVQKAVCTANGGLASKSGPNTYNEFFMTGAFPTNSCEAEPTMISVCDIEKGEVISIDEAKFDSTTQSKDTANWLIRLVPSLKMVPLKSWHLTTKML